MVVEREIAVCRYVRLACQRYLDMLVRAEDPDELFYADPEWAVDACDFLEKLPLSKGGKIGQTLVLAPAQVWLVCAIFIFRRDDPGFAATRGERLVREVYWEIPRGSGKSELLAGIALYVFTCEGESGSQIFIGAPKADQADKVYLPIRVIIEKELELKQRFKLKATLEHVTKADDPSAEIRKISSIDEREDGHDPHLAIMEELHAQDEGLYNVMQSAQGKRTNNLFISITTAGRRAAGIAWMVRRRLISVLEGHLSEDSFLGAIYTIDDADKERRPLFGTPAMIAKANPMYGISLDPSQILEAYKKASTTPAAMLEWERTRLNLWSNGAGALVNPDDWEACRHTDLKIESFRKKRAVIGADLASRGDIASIAIQFEMDFPMGRGIAVFCKHFVPEHSRAFNNANVGAMYGEWVKNGHLVRTRGAVVDFDEIEKQIREWCGMFDVYAVGFDKWQSNQILARLFNDGIPATLVGSGMQTISDPAKEFFGHISAKTLAHDGDPVLGWMALNVVGYIDKRENLLPQKVEPDSELKIDGIAANVTASTLRLDALLDIPVKKKHPWAVRGHLLGQGDGQVDDA